VFIGISSREKNIGAHFISVERSYAGDDSFSGVASDRSSLLVLKKKKYYELYARISYTTDLSL